MVLSAFAFAIVGAFASINNTSVDPANLYAKNDQGECILRCATTGITDCVVPAYETLEECQDPNATPILPAYEPF